MDDRTKLPKKDWKKSKISKKTLMTIGDVNNDIQILKTQSGHQPYITIFDAKGELISVYENKNYSLNLFIDWLLNNR